jgi:hypothetical protein
VPPLNLVVRRHSSAQASILQNVRLVGATVKQTEPATEVQLNAQLAIQDVSERARLWRLAEGRFGWKLRIATLVPLLLLVLGIAIRILDHGFEGFIGEDAGAYFIVLGLALTGLNLWSSTQRQIGALRELLMAMERRRL